MCPRRGIVGVELVVTVIPLVCGLTCFGELGQGTRRWECPGVAFQLDGRQGPEPRWSWGQVKGKLDLRAEPGQDHS